MGQGYSLTTLPSASAGIDAPEMADLTYEKSLGKSRFMKCIRARHKDGLVIAKVVVKPYSSLELNRYVRILASERKELAEIPNALGYHRIVETSTNAYLVRQYINNSLYDRMSTRPFLENVEKKWIAFQLLCAVRDCHARDIYHGDIKAENVLITSWNWLYLTDFSSSFKPTYLPEDNPADFSFFFDTSASDSRDRTCYIAPERFLRAGEDASSKSPVNWAMDIFSVGCLIGEVFTDRKFFSLNGILNYRLSQGISPENPLLKEIQDPEIRDMVAHMIQVNPEDRYAAEEYLTFWKHKAFPEYFYSFLHQYINFVTDPSSGQAQLTSGSDNLGEADERIDRVYNDFDKISYFLGYGDVKSPRKLQLAENELFPLEIDLPDNRHQASGTLKRPPDDGSLIFLTIVVSSIRHTARATSKIRGCELLLAFAERVPDEAKLDRILPYLMLLLTDESDMVKIAALRTITQALALVSVLRLDNAFVFPEYLLRAFSRFVSQSDKQKRPGAWVRATYASCLGSLASTASHFLDIIQTEPSSDPTITESQYQNLYDVARQDLIEQFEAHTKALLTDNDPSVRRALLPSVSTLCVFFGKAKASYVILGYLNTYINDRDWLLKSAFFEAIVGVATYMGTAVLEEFILPLMVQALTDPEESVVEKVIRSFSSIANLGIFQAATVWELTAIVARFTIHPSIWIRESSTQFIAASAKFASVADQVCIIIPLIRDYLKVEPAELSELYLLDTLKKPLPRLIVDMASSWASKSDKSLFWKPVQQQKVFSFGFGEHVSLPPKKAAGVKALSRLAKNDDDEHWIQRLRNAGLELEDEFKLLALQEYIWRTSHRKSQELESKKDPFSGVVALNDLDVPLQTIIFENKKTADQVAAYDMEQAKETKTIMDAIQDATSTEVGVRSLAMRNARMADNQSSRAPINIQDGVRSPTKQSGSPLFEPSSIDSKQSLRIPTSNIQKKGSAINLMGLRDSASKAVANTSMDTTNAFGKVEKSYSFDNEGKKRQQNTKLAKRIKPVHNYPGNDPNVLRLLDSLYLESYPLDSIEFGRVVPVAKAEPLRRGGINPHKGLWQPEGTLIAMLGEHKASIKRIAVAPDHKFFITGSDDGTVKIWDTGRLERTVNHRSRGSHVQGTNVRVTSLCFVENTHCFISTGSDGSVFLVRIDCNEGTGPAMLNQYRSPQVIREFHLPLGEFAVWSEHHLAENHSLMLLATNKSNIYAVELRTMEISYKLENPTHHGTPTCFCVDKRGHWLLLGTSTGLLDLWDLRFKLRVKSWGFPNGLPIHRLLSPMLRGSKRVRVTVAGGAPGSFTALDIEKGTIREVYKAAITTSSLDSSTPQSTPKRAVHQSPVPALLDLDDDQQRPGGFISRFTNSSPLSSQTPDHDQSIRALTMGPHILDEQSVPRHAWYISAGPDWKLRFWDDARADSCTVISGLDVDEARPIYTMQNIGDSTVVTEKEVAIGSAATTASAGGKKKGNKGSVVSLQQQSMLRGHKDVIMDVAVLEIPYGMVVSVDRAGMIYVWC